MLLDFYMEKKAIKEVGMMRKILFKCGLFTYLIGITFSD
ncbi:hypothetical protein C414_000260067 [Campylobacter jejuni subsp. jejuni 414]|nr:hypothetical protein C414_000260067 [Campylobacter jejuni subsp. jejuni 414]